MAHPPVPLTAQDHITHVCALTLASASPMVLTQADSALPATTALLPAPSQHSAQTLAGSSHAQASSPVRAPVFHAVPQPTPLAQSCMEAAQASPGQIWPQLWPPSPTAPSPVAVASSMPPQLAHTAPTLPSFPTPKPTAAPFPVALPQPTACSPAGLTPPSHAGPARTAHTLEQCAFMSQLASFTILPPAHLTPCPLHSAPLALWVGRDSPAEQGEGGDAVAKQGAGLTPALHGQCTPTVLLDRAHEGVKPLSNFAVWEAPVEVGGPKLRSHFIMFPL